MVRGHLYPVLLRFYVRVVCSAVFALGSSIGDVPSASAAPADIRITVSVDWEGRALDEEDLEAMKRLRAQFPSLELLHFLNPVYFTQPGADAVRVRDRIRSVVLPQDQVGLHLHGFRSLIEASGVTFRDTPRFWADGFLEDPNLLDPGYEVPLWAYKTDELRAIVRKGAQLLEQQGFGRPRVFRAGGWQATPDVLEAVSAEGFWVDSSPTTVRFVEKELGGQAIWDWLQTLWSWVQPSTQPYWEATPANTIIELPDNGGLADYLSAEQMLEVYRENAALARAHPGRVIHLHYGFHQETAAKTLGEFSKGLARVLEAARADGIQVRTSGNLACELLLELGGIRFDPN